MPFIHGEGTVIGYSFDHIHLKSRDPEVTARYYRDLFDGVIHESVQLNGRRRFDVKIGSLNLYIAQASPEEHDTGEVRSLGIHHFALRVDDLTQASEELRRRGARFVEEPRTSRLRAGLRVAFVEGPEGVLIELLSTAPIATEV